MFFISLQCTLCYREKTRYFQYDEIILWTIITSVNRNKFCLQTIKVVAYLRILVVYTRRNSSYDWWKESPQKEILLTTDERNPRRENEQQAIPSYVNISCIWRFEIFWHWKIRRIGLDLLLSISRTSRNYRRNSCGV